MKSRRCTLYLATFVISIGYTLLAMADTVTTSNGKILAGKVFIFDEYSYILLLEEGGKIVVPRGRIEEIDWNRPRKPKYRKQSDLIATLTLIEGDLNFERILVGRLNSREAKEKPYELKTEAQTLHYLVESQKQYADAYRIVYSHGEIRYELEYQGEKDMLIRRQYRPTRGESLKILGARGEGQKSLNLAAKGRIPEDEGILSYWLKKGTDSRGKNQVHWSKRRSTRRRIW